MKKLLAIFTVFIVIGSIFSLSVMETVNAQDPPSKRSIGTTILPEGDKISKEECTKKLLDLDKQEDPVKAFKKEEPSERDTILACSIKTGRIHFWMIPYFIVYIIEFLTGIAGLIAILFIVIGGYQLVISGANDSLKDSAKNTIKNALTGLVLTLIAWTVVNLIQYIVTI
ncbi:hypothetical protein J7J83_00855 [bacterium]|nr:hypothetical protein [bacterium]